MSTQENTTQAKAYALLVGVDDYQAYDSSSAQDLPGSVNDVMAWHATLLRRGYESDNIRVLVSPVPPALRALGALPATRTNIERGLAWLETQIQDRDSTAGVFTFSGHGDVDENGQPVICPTDTSLNDEGHLTNTLSLGVILRQLPRNAVAFLDCCHSGPSDLVTAPSPAIGPGVTAANIGSPGLNVSVNPAVNPSAITIGTGRFAAGRAMLLSLRGKHPVQLDKPSFLVLPIQCRVLSAATLGGTAFQAEFMGRYQGALTWAVTSALGQWQLVPAQITAPPSVTLSSQGARDHVESMLASIEMPQTTELYGAPVATPELAKRVPLLGRGIEGPVSEVPDARRVPIQFPPDLKVWLGTNLNPATVGQAGVVNALTYTPPGSYQRNREYWRLTDTFLNDITSLTSPASRIDFMVDTSQRPPSWDNIITSPPKPLFWMDLVPDWQNSSAPSGEGYYTNDTKLPIAAVFFNLIRPENNGGRWGGTITWFRVYNATVGPAVFDASGRSFVRMSNPPAGTSTLQWQRAVFSPNAV